MGIQFSGVLRDPSGALAANVPLKFTSTINIGDMLISAPMVFTTNQFGQYDFNLELGRYHFEVRFETAFYTLGLVDIHNGLPNPSTISLLIATTAPIEPGSIDYAESLLALIQQEAGKVSADKAQVDLWRNDIDAWHQDIASKHYDIQLWHSDVLTKAFEVGQDHKDIGDWHTEIDTWHTDVEQWKNEVQEDREYIDNLVKNPDNQFPVPPAFVNISVYDTFVSLAPDTSELSWVGEFEFYLRGKEVNGARVFKGRGRYMEIIGLFPETTYYFSVRAVNSLGVSEYLDVQATTTNLGLDTKYQLGLEPDVNLGLILDQFDRDLHTYKDTLDNYDVIIDNIGRSQAELVSTVDTSLGEFAARQDEYQWRLDNNISLIDTLISVDPVTGQIINKAFEYTDTSYTEAGIRIDGINSLISLHTEDLTQVNNILTNQQATLELHDSQISLKASYTEVEGLIASSLSALEPAYSWQFNTNTDGWASTTWNSQGYITTTGSTNITGISFDGTENPVIRFMVRTADKDTAFLDVSWNGGNQHIYIPVAYVNGAWIAATKELTVNDGWTGSITSLQLGGSVLDLDFIVVGKRSANEQQLDSLTVRVSTVEETLDAENARWSVYVTTDFWDTNALTSSDVTQAIDGWNTTWGVTAKLQVLDEEGTIQKANNAKLWIDGADATIDARVNSWWVNGEESNLRSAELSIDALKGEIRNTVSSVSGLDKNINNVSYENFRLAYGDLLNANGTAKQGIAIAYAQEKLTVLTEGQQATATKLLELDAVNETSAAKFNSIDQAFVDVNEAIVTQGSELEAKVGEAQANAEKYTRAAVSFWVDGSGQPVDAPPDPNNPPAGWQKLNGPIAEDIRKLSITTGTGTTASIGEIAQVFEDKNGQLMVRGGLLLDNNGRVTGFTAYDDGQQSNLDLIGENVRIGYADVNQAFIPLLNFDTTAKILAIKARLILSDGHTVNNLNDIKGTDGSTIYKVYQHSPDGINNWHSDMVTGDRYQRDATVINGVQGAWSAAYQIVGNDGVNGYTPVKGVDYFDGINGAFNSFVYKTGVSLPAPPTGGSYNGTVETIPVSWSDDPYYTSGEITWISQTKYTQNASGVWVNSGWSYPSVFIKQGDPGANGANGANGTNGLNGAGMYGAYYTTIDWSTGEANLRFTNLVGRAPIRFDIFSQTLSNGADSQVREYTGSSWITVAMQINGSLVARGTIAGDKIIAGTEIASPVITGGLVRTANSPASRVELQDDGTFLIWAGSGAKTDVGGTFWIKKDGTGFIKGDFFQGQIIATVSASKSEIINPISAISNSYVSAGKAASINFSMNASFYINGNQTANLSNFYCTITISRVGMPTKTIVVRPIYTFYSVEPDLGINRTEFIFSYSGLELDNINTQGSRTYTIANNISTPSGINTLLNHTVTMLVTENKLA